MGLTDLNAKRIAIVALVTVVMLVGGNAAHAYLTMERPVAAFLRSYPGVLSYQIERPQGRGPEVTVKLDRMADFSAAYTELEAGLASKLGPCLVLVEDDRSEELTAFWDQAHVAVHEGVASGQFVSMRDRLMALADACEVDLRVTVQAERVYVQATTADAYLYQVIGRATGGGQ